MNNPLNKMRHNSAAVFSAWLMIGYILARVGIEVYDYIRLLLLPASEYSPSVVWIPHVVDYTVVIYVLPFVLFAVYLLFLYRRNRHNVLMPIAFTLAALLQLLVLPDGIWRIFQSLSGGLFLQSLAAFYVFFSDVTALIGFAIYALFAVDGFCKFRLRKVSRVMAVVLFGLSIVLRLLQLLLLLNPSAGTIWYFSLHPLVNMLLDLLLYGSLMVFFFGAAEKDDRIRLIPCHATVSRQLSDSYVAPVVPTPARFCGHCGSPVQGGLCPNCGAQD